MAILRRNLTQIVDEIYRIVGNYNLTTNPGLDTPWRQNANLYRIINDYIQRLGQRAAQVIQKDFPRRPVRFDMYKTVITSVGTSSDPATELFASVGNTLIYFPQNLDEIISLYDTTNREVIHPLKDGTRFHKDLRHRPPGPPEYYEMQGFGSGSGAWRKQARLYPRTEASTTPALELFYWRLPAIMPGSDPDNEYPDIDPKYQYLVIIGSSLEILRPNDPAFPRYEALEKELLIDLITSGSTT